MNRQVKEIILQVISVIALPFRVFPSFVRRSIVFSFLVIESRISAPKKTLRNLFLLKDKLEMLINERASVYGEGEHPKHILMKYHDYFISNISDDSTVLDIGCGHGAVAKSIAKKIKGVVVTGIDNNKERLNQAKLNNRLKNIDFIYGDILEISGEKKYDVIVLSNVLEHIEERVNFIKKIIILFSPKTILVRVPLFERHWEVAMRKKLEINYFSDSTHFIEHTKEEFENEINDAGLRIDDIKILWGEIWARCSPNI